MMIWGWFNPSSSRWYIFIKWYLTDSALIFYVDTTLQRWYDRRNGSTSILHGSLWGSCSATKQSIKTRSTFTAQTDNCFFISPRTQADTQMERDRSDSYVSGDKLAHFNRASGSTARLNSKTSLIKTNNRCGYIVPWMQNLIVSQRKWICCINHPTKSLMGLSKIHVL